MKIMGDKSIVWFPGVSVGYERENVIGYNLYFEYNFTYDKVEVIKFAVTNPSSPDIIGYTGVNLNLYLNNIDLGISEKLTENINYTIGPSFAAVYRILVNYQDYPHEVGIYGDLFDKLSSLCIGANASLNMQIPLTSDTRYFFFYSSLKFRYLHSLWFDAKGRNVSNYYQSFLFSQLNLGIGFNF
jgi:hypothetical protein